MKRMTRKLALHKEIVRSLRDGDLLIAQGGRPNPTVSACATECPPKNTVGCTEGIVCGTTLTAIC